ncbi:MAG TPA: hypothetical protein VGQ45_09120 [Gaiellales bacterium]|nr:hypothetical protein [Gaiellales bacterium]
MSKLAGMLGLAAAGAAVLAYDRAKRIAEDEGRPLGEVLAEMPGKLFADLRTIPDDVREAAEEGRRAAERRSQEIDDEISDLHTDAGEASAG